MEEEKSAQKKEELEKETRKNNYLIIRGLRTLDTRLKKEAKIWVILKSTVEEEKLAQKKEEQEKEIRKNNHEIVYASNYSN